MMTHVRYWVPRLAIFFAPLAVTAMALAVLAFHSGEAMPLALVHAIQEADPSVLYQIRSRDTVFGYKLMGVERQRPDVLMVGSSRTLAFRRGFLTNAPDAFYNAGMQGAKLDDVASLVHQLTPETAPRILIVGIDQYWFNAAYSDQRNPAPFMTGDLTPDLWFRLTRRVVQDMLRGRVPLGALIDARSPLSDNRALGLSAIMSGAGYRNDGSHFAGRDALTARRIERLLASRQPSRALDPGDAISDEALATLESMLIQADALGMTLVGVALPLAPHVYAETRSGDGYGYLEQALAALPALFDSYGQPLVDLTDPALLDIDPVDIADGTHPSDRLSARIFAAVVRAVPALGAYSDPDRLDAMADAALPTTIFD